MTVNKRLITVKEYYIQLYVNSFKMAIFCCCCCCYIASVMSDSVRPHRRQPTRLPHPWDSPSKNTGVGCYFLLRWMKVKSESEVAQSCAILSGLMDCSLPGSSIHGIFQARVLEWGAIAFSKQSGELFKLQRTRETGAIERSDLLLLAWKIEIGIP